MNGSDDRGHVLTRKELYERVWATPMRHLAREFGLSDVGLRKICVRHAIPTPPVGYWAKKEFGKAPPRPDLPAGENGVGEQIVIEPATISAQAPPTSSRAGEQGIEISVPDQLLDPHPVVARTASSLRAARGGEDGLLRPGATKALPVAVSTENIDRMMRIADALVKAIEARGHRILVPEEKDQRGIIAEVLGERIPVLLQEGTDREERPLTPREEREKERSPWLYREPRYRVFPTGRLSLEIVTPRYFSGLEGARRRWGDGAKQRLESCLPAFLLQLENVARAFKQDRLEREENERKRRAWELERTEKLELIRKEEERLKGLNAEVDAWHASQRIRRYTNAIRAAAMKKHGRIAEGSELDRWLVWAEQQADRLDPLVKSPPSILDEKRKWSYW